MNPALVFLFRRSLVNRIRGYFARLRQVKYLLPALLGLGYFVMLFAGPLANGGRQGHQPLPAMDGFARYVPWAVGALVLVIALLSWLIPSTKPGLVFKEAEIAYLFPAPLTRREILTFKILQMQAPLVFTVLIFGILFGGRSLGFPRGLYVALGFWLSLNVFSLHQIGVRMTHTSLARHGTKGLRRQAPVLLVILAFLAALAVCLPALPDLGLERLARDPSTFDGARLRSDLAGWFGRLEESPAAWLLYPFRLIALVPASPDLPTFLSRFLQEGILAVFLFLWVVRTDAAFEEAAAAQAEEVGQALAAVRAGKFPGRIGKGDRVRRAPWRLRSPGPPEPAYVWKGAVTVIRTFSPVFLMAILPGLLAAMFVLNESVSRRSGHSLPLFSILLMMGAFMSMFFGGMFPAFGLRGELQNVETLKTLPVPAPRLIRSILAGFVAPFAALQILLVLLAVAAFPDLPDARVTLAWRVAAFLSLALLMPSLTALSVGVDSVAPLLFPAWIRPGEVFRGGMEGMGQGILMMLVKGLGMLGGILLPAVVGGGLATLGILFLPRPFGPAAVLLGAAAAAAVLVTEVHLLCLWLGDRFERLDPAAEGMLEG